MEKLLWKTKLQQASAHKETVADSRERAEIIAESKIFIDALYKESVLKKGSYNSSLFELNQNK